MDLLKTIFRLSFFLLGCIMLVLSLLVIPVGYSSFIWFFSFSILFFLLGYKMTFYVIGFIFMKVFKFPKMTISSGNKDWVIMNHENIVYNEAFKELKLNDKLYRYSQIKSIDLFVNNKKTELDQLKKVKTIKSLEIKLGVKVNKITYKKFKYINNKDNEKLKKRQIKKAVEDYEKLYKLIKLQKDKKSKNLQKNKKNVKINLQRVAIRRKSS